VAVASVFRYVFAAVAHQVEQQTENLCVAGSSPARGTRYVSVVEWYTQQT
jgi:hypothetical protein